MSNYAIFRIAKKSNLSQVRRMAKHHLREAPTPNADPAGSIEVLQGADSADDVTAIIAGATKPLMKRKDAVRCFDMLMTTSPEWWKENPDKHDEFKRAAMAWAGKTFNSDNIVSAVLHLDETTGHIQCLVTPIRDGKLNAKSWTGSPKQLQGLQDSYADAMKHLGLERGVKGSKAVHEDIKRWYGELHPRMKKAESLIKDASVAEEKSIATAADLQRQAAALTEARIELADMSSELTGRARELEDREKFVADKAASNDAFAKQLDEKQGRLAALEAALTERANALIEAFKILPSNIQKQLEKIFGMERKPPAANPAMREKTRPLAEPVPEKRPTKKPAPK